MRVFTSADEIKQAVGVDLGYSDWLVITQERIDRFAEATGDDQWIHVDRERASRGPFGRTIAHGWLTVSLLPMLTKQIFRVEARMAINYGINRLRFPSPVPVGSAIRATVSFTEVTDVGEAVQVVKSATIQVRGSDKPAVAAETVGRYYL